MAFCLLSLKKNAAKLCSSKQSISENKTFVILFSSAQTSFPNSRFTQTLFKIMAVHAKSCKRCFWSCTLLHFTELNGKSRVLFFLKTVSNYNTNIFKLIIEANQIIYILNFLCLPLLHNRWRCIHNTLQHSILT